MVLMFVKTTLPPFAFQVNQPLYPVNYYSCFFIVFNGKTLRDQQLLQLNSINHAT